MIRSPGVTPTNGRYSLGTPSASVTNKNLHRSREACFGCPALVSVLGFGQIPGAAASPLCSAQGVRQHEPRIRHRPGRQVQQATRRRHCPLTRKETLLVVPSIAPLGSFCGGFVVRAVARITPEHRSPDLDVPNLHQSHEGAYYDGERKVPLCPECLEWMASDPVTISFLLALGLTRPN